jgi:hypothetical protein
MSAEPGWRSAKRHSGRARFSLLRERLHRDTGVDTGVLRSRRHDAPEKAMKTMFDDLATALVSATLCLATVSMFIVVFASAT